MSFGRTVSIDQTTLPKVPSVPAVLAAASADANLKLWLYDTRDGAAIGTAIFIQKLDTNAPWRFVPANSDGSLYLTLEPGSYQFDVVEPRGQGRAMSRQHYFVTVAPGGNADVAGISASSGVFPVTLAPIIPPATDAVRMAQAALLARADEPVSQFRPASPCQLSDQVTASRGIGTDVSAGFPKVPVRLPSYGHIRALIVPVDFPGLKGRDNPLTYYGKIANDVRDFYLKQSYGRLAFDFTIVPNWVHLPFKPSRFGIGRRNGSGDFTAYRNEIVALTDRQIDYSQYDAVYFLVPKETPSSMMGWGPAITRPTWTSTGWVVNGATGGADMYRDVARGTAWKWMAHETGHALGLYDEDLRHAEQTLGYWGIMAMGWSEHAIEHNGWDRYLQGWLDDSQVACLSRDELDRAPVTVSLSPLVRQSQGVKVALVPLSPSRILVMESRKAEGYDRIPPGREGVLVYTVDMTIGQLGGGYRTQRRPGSTDPNFEDAALRTGDSVTVDGVMISVSAGGKDGETIQLRTAEK